MSSCHWLYDWSLFKTRNDSRREQWDKKRNVQGTLLFVLWFLAFARSLTVFFFSFFSFFLSSLLYSSRSSLVYSLFFCFFLLSFVSFFFCI